MTRACLISIGDELTSGLIVNTNAAFLAQQLSDMGFYVSEIITIPDNLEAISQSLKLCQNNNQLVITTGGLGPTSDDVTKSAIAKAFNTKLILNQQVLDQVINYLKTRGRELTPNNQQQALVPENAQIIPNPHGTAPGLWIEHQNTVFVFMPGVPFEMKLMFEQKLKPLLNQRFKLPFTYSRIIHTLGKPEAEIAEMLKDFEQKIPSQVKIAYLPSPQDIKIRLWGQSHEPQQLKNIIDQLLGELTQILKQYVWGLDNTSLPAEVQKRFVQNKLTLATAESCTGGSIAQMITSVPGSSQYYKGTVVAYSNQVKTNVLQVNPQDLEQHGAVSKPVVMQMAQNVRKLLNADYAVATSGIAGPSGGTAQKPVGTTWIAVATPTQTIARKFLFGKLREINIQRASAMALFLVLKTLEDEQSSTF